jgi:hypothetical protein
VLKGPDYNVAPTKTAPVMIARTGRRPEGCRHGADSSSSYGGHWKRNLAVVLSQPARALLSALAG